MSVRFGNNRIATFIIFWMLSGTVLGIAAHFGSIFLPHLHPEFIIFSIVVSALTIFLLLITVNFAQPWTEATMTTVLSVLWLAMGAWSTDLIGHVECSSFGNSPTPTASGTISARTYCYETRVIQAFSWMLFGLLVIYLMVLLTLVNRAQSQGFNNIWYSHIAYVPWFGEWISGAYPMYPGMAPQQPYYYQQPGRSLVIQPGVDGAAPMVTSVPT